MFTGIIESTGVIVATEKVTGGRRLSVDFGPSARDASNGDSICVSGVCLTVTNRNEDIVSFDVIKETLDKTNLGRRREGDKVNFELSLRVGDRLDGHFVQGHVDGTATVDAVRATPDEHVVWCTPQEHLRPYVIPKGSIAIDGVSLTIAEVDGPSFSVALIPTTLDRTTFAALKAGDLVNIESDILARTIVHRLAAMQLPTGEKSPPRERAGGP